FTSASQYQYKAGGASYPVKYNSSRWLLRVVFNLLTYSNQRPHILAAFFIAITKVIFGWIF
ncbi:hypothetical protein DPA88_24475, partial [Salmonella enterica subsp. salamae]|nr:hypothetical protein [Salmonella enterica subsp. enterica serovar Enteritidis]ECA3871613.1 hypothetical protein [Salmonella enterica subsp. enterica serovar Bispebjerg]ECI4341211.1 hypothetical protein [Salmonella enterica subsp. salamae]EBY3772243.1 hypothetical protein [Salmonella enterica subsp. enterica serovar Enteritidis]EBY6573682.1 hypothetical protein [Salmonella enterica subsp. enterica serovar Enteritidis]